MEWWIRSEAGQEIPVADEMAGILGRHAESGPRVEEIKTAVTEACLNAIEHGNRLARDKRVKIVLYIFPHEWVIRTYDEGGGFSLNAAERIRTVRENEDDPRGWGLLLIRTFADRIATGWDQGMFYIQMHFVRGK